MQITKNLAAFSFVAAAALSIPSTGALAVRRLCSAGSLRDRRRRQSRVAILHEGSYDGPLDCALIQGLRLFDLSLRGKTVLLKPNLVEYIPGSEVNTDPRLVGAATSAFLALSTGERSPDPRITLIWWAPSRTRFSNHCSYSSDLAR